MSRMFVKLSCLLILLAPSLVMAASWEQIASVPSECFLDVAVVDDRLVVSSWGGGIYTGAPGDELKRAQVPAETEWITGLSFQGERGWASGSDGVLYQTTGDNRWSKFWEFADLGLNDVAVTPDGRVFVVGTGGIVVRPGRGKDRWERKQLLQGDIFQAITFTDERNGFIVGLNGSLFATADGGDTWERRLTPAETILYDIAFTSPKQGLAVGRGGTVIATNDGGNRWLERSLGAQKELTSVVALPDGAGFVVAGEDGIVRRGNADGQGWQRLDLDEPRWIHGLLVHNGMLYAVGVRGSIWRRSL